MPRSRWADQGVHRYFQPYEAPEKPELCLDTGAQDLEQCVATVINLLRSGGSKGFSLNSGLLRLN